MLKESLSPLEAGMRQMDELLEAEQEEIDLLLSELEKMYKRLYVKSSDITGIRYWEEDFAVSHDDTLTIEQRRARILAKINGSASATKEMLENLVKQVLGADRVTIVEYPREYRFVIYVSTKTYEENMKIADAAVDEARPAHLAYKFINALYRKYRCGFYIGTIGCVRRAVVREVDAGGWDFDKYRCRYYLGIVGCTKKMISEGRVDVYELYINE